jgi:hypothetical protein
MPPRIWVAFALLAALALACFGGYLSRARAAIVVPTREQGAALIRMQGYPCSRITRVRKRGNVVRVECGRSAYRVTLEPLSLRPW